MSKGDEPINFIPEEESDRLKEHGYMTLFKGLTKREYFAGLAMQAYISNPQTYGGFATESIAQASVRKADALLSELSKSEKP